MKIMNKKIFVLISLLTTPCTRAQWQNTCANEPASCCPNKCFNWELFGGPIFYKACQDGMDTAIVSTSTSQLDEADPREPHWKYKTGFELGIGLYFPNHDIDLVGSVHHLHSCAKDSYTSDTNNIFSAWSIPGNLTPAKDLSADWKMKFDMADVEVGALFFPNCNLNLRFFGGLKGVRINQKFDLTFTGGRSTGQAAYDSTDTIYLKNKYWGIGPRAGFQTFFNSCHGLGLYLHGALSMLVGKYCISEQELVTFEGITVDPEHLELYDSYQRLRPVGEASIGIRWDAPVSCDSWALTLIAAWDCFNFWGQNQLRKVVNQQNWANIKGDYDLALYGPKLIVRAEF